MCFLLWSDYMYVCNVWLLIFILMKDLMVRFFCSVFEILKRENGEFEVGFGVRVEEVD